MSSSPELGLLAIIQGFKILILKTTLKDSAFEILAHQSMLLSVLLKITTKHNRALSKSE